MGLPPRDGVVPDPTVTAIDRCPRSRVFSVLCEYEVAVLIETLGVMEGRLPPRVLSLVVEWAGLHQPALLENWNTLRSSGQFRRIEPLA